MRSDRQQFLLIALAIVAGVVIGRASVRAPSATSTARAAEAAATAGAELPIDPPMLTADEPSDEMVAAIRRQAIRSQRAYAAAVAPIQALTLMRMRLRETMTAEEAYMADHGAYAEDYSHLMLMERGDSVTVTIRWASPLAWVAEATHPAFPAGSCVAAGGAVETIPPQVATRRDGLRSEAPFHIACDPVSER